MGIYVQVRGVGNQVRKWPPDVAASDDRASLPRSMIRCETDRQEFVAHDDTQVQLAGNLHEQPICGSVRFPAHTPSHVRLKDHKGRRGEY